MAQTTADGETENSLEADELDGKTMVRECVCAAMAADHTQGIVQEEIEREVSDWVVEEGFEKFGDVWERVIDEARDFMDTDEFEEHVEFEYIRARNNAESRGPPVGSNPDRERRVVARSHIRRENELVRER